MHMKHGHFQSHTWPLQMPSGLIIHEYHNQHQDTHRQEPTAYLQNVQIEPLNHFV